MYKVKRDACFGTEGYWLQCPIAKIHCNGILELN
jgi:hypothetical protein